MEEEVKAIKECLDLSIKISHAEACIIFLKELDLLYPFSTENSEILILNILTERLHELKVYGKIFMCDTFPYNEEHEIVQEELDEN